MLADITTALVVVLGTTSTFAGPLPTEARRLEGIVVGFDLAVDYGFVFNYHVDTKGY